MARRGSRHRARDGGDRVLHCRHRGHPGRCARRAVDAACAPLRPAEYFGLMVLGLALAVVLARPDPEGGHHDRVRAAALDRRAGHRDRRRALHARHSAARRRHRLRRAGDGHLWHRRDPAQPRGARGARRAGGGRSATCCPAWTTCARRSGRCCAARASAPSSASCRQRCGAGPLRLLHAREEARRRPDPFRQGRHRGGGRSRGRQQRRCPDRVHPA